MSYSPETKPGLADPYWYEWSVGLTYIIRMLYPDSNIKHVELQADVALGLDDVVVTYNNDRRELIQVKHTRAENTLTFGDLVSGKNTNDMSEDGMSLLKQLARGWAEEKDKYDETRVILYTNRKAGTRISTVKTTGNKRPALSEFLHSLSEKVAQASSLSEISFPEYKDAWNEWLLQLSDIPNDSDKLSFIQYLRIEDSSPSLLNLENDIIELLMDAFCTNKTNAITLLSSLDHALRTWTTSSRHSVFITREDVYEALALSQKPTFSFNHDLVPSEPFFSSRFALVQTIENEIRDGENRVIFISGVPGTGKTNVISKLAAKNGSLLDIRYYAYEPIDPGRQYLPTDVSKRVDARCFWNELFCQLRKKLRGQLFRYKVPVINELLTLEQMRTTFFDIASAYAKDRGRDFIVAIDGIDHAARALNVKDTFLPTLPSPEYLPRNVKIVLAGQPKRNYEHYPTWMFSNAELISEISIPGLVANDVRQLVDSRFIKSSIETRQQIAELVAHYAEGNTLAAIFAVHEAVQSSDLSQFEQRLINRKLSGNIQNYYEEIWGNVKKSISPLFIDYKIAGVLALFNEPINENILSSIFASLTLNQSDWLNILKLLRPLVIENEGYYTILHNDVRVFLSSVIGRDDDHVREVYSCLSDYYLNLTPKTQAYYKDIVSFAIGANRLIEFQSFFTPEFIIEAYVYGVDIGILSDDSWLILKEILSVSPINWHQMRDLSLCYQTIEQIEKSSYEIDDMEFRIVDKYEHIHPYECYVESKSAWSNELITSVFQLSETLFEKEIDERAICLINRWFSDINIVQIVDHISIPNMEEEDFFSPEEETLATIMGKTLCLAKASSIIHGYSDLIHMHSGFVYHFVKSFMSTAVEHYTGEDLSSVISYLEICYPDTVIDSIQKLLTDNRLSDIVTIESVFHDRMQASSIGVLFSAFMRIIATNPEWTVQDKSFVAEQIITDVISDLSIDYEMQVFCVYAFVLAYCSQKDSADTARYVCEAFMKNHSYRNHSYYSVYFNAICLLGQIYSYTHAQREIIINQTWFRQCFDSLFLKRWKPNDIEYHTQEMLSIVLKGYIAMLPSFSSAIQEVIKETCENIFSKNPVNSLMDAGFYYYRNRPERQNEWVQNWLGHDGLAWSDSIGSRNRLIKRFLRVKQIYDLTNVIDVDSIIDKARWSVIGYSSHKEYVADYLLNWYKELTAIKPAYIQNYAIQIKEISEKIEDVGDNRRGHIVNSKVFEDIFSCDFQTILQFMQNNHYLLQSLETPDYFVYGIIGYLRTHSADRRNLLELWSIGVGLLNWKDESQHATICSLQNTIEVCAERSGFIGIKKELEKIAPAYIDLSYDPSRYIIPDHWSNLREKNCQENSVEDLIAAYMSGKGIKREELAGIINEWYPENAIESKMLTELLEYELSKDDWSIEQNALVSILIHILPSGETDPLIAKYLLGLPDREYHHVERDLPALAMWKSKCEGEEYSSTGMEQLIRMHRNWLTSVNHFPYPESIDDYNYAVHIDWSNISDIGMLFYQILKLIIQSDNSEAIQMALSGLFALECLNAKYIDYIERDWNTYNYKAKEWILMTYELLCCFSTHTRASVIGKLKNHCNDESLNAALYAGILYENYSQNEAYVFEVPKPLHYDSIPSIGWKRFLRGSINFSPWMNGSKYVEWAVSRIETVLGGDYSDLEERTNTYESIMDDNPQLIPLLPRHKSGIMNTLDKVIIAFMQIIHKDWYDGRWTGVEMEIARVILTSSEPYITLVSPRMWGNNEGYLIRNIDEFIALPPAEQRKEITLLLNTGVNEDYIVLGGSVHEYSHDREIIGYMLCYCDTGADGARKALYSFSMNARYVFQSRDSFPEYPCQNITHHFSGVESFQLSNISIGFRKAVLQQFEWQIKLTSSGFSIVNNEGEQIGYLENYYGIKNIGNRYVGFQPRLQRWLIRKAEFNRVMLKYPEGQNVRVITDVTQRPHDK